MSQESAGQLLSDAAFAERLDDVRELIENGADINARDRDGFTALHRTCVTGKTNVIKVLLEHGADVNSTDMYGDSPLHYACFCGHKEAIELLLAYGADPTRQSGDGKTPIDSAREEKHEHIFPILDKYAPEVTRLKPKPPAAPPSANGASNGPSKVSAEEFGLGKNSSTIIGGTGQTGTVAGLDFSKGVIIEGELQKKRANKVLAWRKKYYIMSSTYGAMFFWTGSRDHQEGVIKKVRFETFYKIVHHMDKKEARRFDIKVVTGRTMCLLANTTEEAKAWVETIRRELGHYMGVLKIQAAWRKYAAVKKLAAIKKQRKAAVDKIIATKANLPDGLRPDKNGVVIEGPLKKKNHNTVSNILGSWRLRYFVLNIDEAQLYYYETKAKRNAGFLPRSIPVLSFFSVSKFQDPKQSNNGRRFSLKVSSGRTYQFESPSAKTTDQWVAALQAVLPRDHIAAIKIQSTYRMFKAKQLRVQLKNKKEDVVKSLSEQAGKSEQQLLRLIVKIQAMVRMFRLRRKFLKEREARRRQEEKMKEVKKKRLWLKRSNRIAAAAEGDKEEAQSPSAGKGSAAPAQNMTTKNRLARLKKLKQKKEKNNNAMGAEGATKIPLVDERGVEWTKHFDEQDQPFYASTQEETSWEPPDNTVGTDYYPYYQTTDADSGDKFFVNAYDDETSWDMPPGWQSHCDISDENARKEAREGADVYHWSTAEDPESGAVYFVNSVSGRRQWDKPPGWDTYIAEQKGTSGDEWVEVEDPTTGKPYWYNPETGERKFATTKDTGVVDGDVDSDDEDGAASGPSEESKKDQPEWEELTDPTTKKTYYYNSKTGESKWAEEDTAEEDDELNVHEAFSFTSFVNEQLQGCADEVPGLPLDTEADPPAIVEALRNGVVLTKLVNSILPDSVDERVLDFDATPMEERPSDKDPSSSVRPARENIQLALSAAASHGAFFQSQDVSTLAGNIEQGHGPTILDVVWRLWKLDLDKELNVRSKPELLLLAKHSESAKDMVSLSPQDILLRWINHHLSRSSFEVKPVKNVEDVDLPTCAALLLEVAPDYCGDVPKSEEEVRRLSGGDEDTVEDLANKILAAGFGAGVPSWFTSGTFVPPNGRLQYAFLAYLLQNSPGLDYDTKKRTTSTSNRRATQMSADVDTLKAELADISGDQDAAGTKELRTFTTWINSLGIKSVHVNDLVADVSDGLMPLRVINHVEEGIVNWKRVNKRPKSRFQRVENCNYLITLGQAMDFHLVNVGGLDFVDGNAKIVQGFVWQLMRHHTLKLLSQIAFDGFGADEADILQWANDTVKEANGGDNPGLIRSFKDPKLSTGIYLLTLLSQVRPVINWDLVTSGQSDEDKERNAKYLLSAARKMGAIVFCTWDDIVEVNSRMIMLFVASIMVIYNEIHGSYQEASGEESD
eukprot:gb/GECG01008975.1/.p1 GENE.gb/GECG01008975.1/~~gb/GECG01008975.1/.p1  ORF type:complete len:1407 (+),score=241.60 gb/GECG01008975.1/:1-4221(+)